MFIHFEILFQIVVGGDALPLTDVFKLFMFTGCSPFLSLLLHKLCSVWLCVSSKRNTILIASPNMITKRIHIWESCSAQNLYIMDVIFLDLIFISVSDTQDVWVKSSWSDNSPVKLTGSCIRWISVEDRNGKFYLCCHVFALKRHVEKEYLTLLCHVLLCFFALVFNCLTV